MFKNNLIKIELQFLKNNAVQILNEMINAIDKASKGHIGGTNSIVQDLDVTKISSRNMVRAASVNDLNQKEIQWFSDDFYPSVIGFACEMKPGNFCNQFWSELNQKIQKCMR